MENQNTCSRNNFNEEKNASIRDVIVWKRKPWRKFFLPKPRIRKRCLLHSYIYVDNTLPCVLELHFYSVLGQSWFKTLTKSKNMQYTGNLSVLLYLILLLIPWSFYTDFSICVFAVIFQFVLSVFIFVSYVSYIDINLFFMVLSSFEFWFICGNGFNSGTFATLC